MMNKKLLYFICFILSSGITVTAFYIELQIILKMVNFQEPIYHLPGLGITLEGSEAALAHTINFFLGTAAIIVTGYCYGKLR